MTRCLQAEKAVTEVVVGYDKHYHVKSRNMTASSLDLIIELRTAKGDELVGQIVAVEGIASASLLSHDGEVTFYDKRHLFRLGGETKRFTAGQDRVVVEWQGVKFLLQTCYDIRFPVFSRNRVCGKSYDYDAIIYVANFPTAREIAWRTLTAARAIENEAFVVAVNRTGVDPYCNYSGGSVLWDSFGQVVAQCGDKEEIVVAELDIDELYSRRRRFATLNDGDLYNIE